MRGVRLADLREDLRAEIGHSTNPAVGVNAKDYLDQVLRRTQNRLWEEYDWQHLKVSRDIPVTAGQRYYSTPNDLRFERVLEVSFKYGGDWHPLTYGITESDYNTYDSDNGERSYPICKWDVAEDTGAVDDVGVFEVWPLPANSSTQYTGGLRMTGYRNIKQLNLDSDVCELDGTLIVLFAAAEIQARQKQGDAALKLKLATDLLSRLQGFSSNKKKTTGFNNDAMTDLHCGPRPRIIGSVTSLGGRGGNSNPEGPPYDLSINVINDLADVNAVASDGWVLTWSSAAGQWVAAESAGGGPAPDPGVEEAPEDGNLYGRKDAGWEVIATQTGDYLPRDGSLPMIGQLDIWNNNKARWFEDDGTTQRIRIGVSEELPVNRAKIRLFDVDGNTGDTEAVVDIRSETDSSEDTVKSAIVLQPSMAASDAGRTYAGYIGFNNIDKTEDTAHFGFQGTAEDYGLAQNRRRAWFGTNWEQGSDPAAVGLNNIQLYINRPAPGLNYPIDLQLNDEAVLQVSDGGWMWNAGPGRFGQRLDDDPENMFQIKKGVGIEIGYHINQLGGLAGGVIQVKDRDQPSNVYKPLFMYGSEMHFNIGDVEADLAESDVRIWPNPDSPDQAEIALFNKAQIRVYKSNDSNVADRSIESLGNGSAANGWRIIKWDGTGAAITIAAQSNGTNFIDIVGDGAEYRLNGSPIGVIPTAGAVDGDVLRFKAGAWEITKAFQLDNVNNVEVLRLRANQYVAGVDEVSLMNDAQLRSYGGTGKRQWETIGSGSGANGMRIIRADGPDSAGVTIACTDAGVSFINLAGSTVEYQLNGVKLNAAAVGAAETNHTHNNYVATSGNQTVNGIKTFGSIINANGKLRAGTTASIPSQCSVYGSGTFGCQTLPVVSGGQDAAWGFGVLGYRTCDVRLKENITDMPYGLLEVLEIEPIAFNWRDSGARDMGFSAQQLSSVMPEAAPYEEKSDRYGISSTVLLAALVNAIKTISDRLDQLEGGS